jgi:hypothetical protein
LLAEVLPLWAGDFSRPGGNRSGIARTGRESRGRAGEKAGVLNDCCADGILESTARLGQVGKEGEPRHFEEFINRGIELCDPETN